ncbi:hypothetical protein DMENIID0001_154700 [Sergentomyia squamirostris]
MFVAGNIEHKFKKGELIRRRSNSPSNAPPPPNFRSKKNSRSRSRGDSSDDDRAPRRRLVPVNVDSNKRRYEEDRRSRGSRSPNGPDLRDYLATRKPRSYRDSRSPPPRRPRTPTDDEKRVELEKKLADLKASQGEYEKNPESHPQYQDEWCSYWNRRCEELQQFGIDIDNYDFKPEWLTFWKRRLKELHDEECLPIFKALREVMERTKLLAHNRNDDSWSTDEDEGAPKVKPKPKPKPKPVPPPLPVLPPVVKRPRTPSPELRPKRRPPPTLSPVRSQRSNRSRSPSLSFHELGSSEETLTIDSALQKITSLEDSLSQIGPKVIDLVGKSMTLIDGMDFESFDRNKDMPSAKDRLNGQMLTNKMNSVLKTFENITSILKRMIETPSKTKKTKNDQSGLNDDVKQWMSIFTDVIDNMDDSRHYQQPSTNSQTEHLTDPEVEALLQNFDSLSEKEKNHLIMFLKSLEKTDEERVKRFSVMARLRMIEILMRYCQNPPEAPVFERMGETSGGRTSHTASSSRSHDFTSPRRSDYPRSAHPDNMYSPTQSFEVSPSTRGRGLLSPGGRGRTPEGRLQFDARKSLEREFNRQYHPGSRASQASRRDLKKFEYRAGLDREDDDNY